MLKVGITGGIGAGKSTVAKVFAVLGVPTYNADEQAKLLMNTHLGLRQQLILAFGADVYNAEGLDRKRLGELVFNNAEQLVRLNDLVHPLVIGHANAWMAHQKAPYVLKEAALMFESGSQAGLDYVIGVFAPEAVRVRRAMQRDGSGEAAVEARLSKQLDEGIKMKLCDAAISNDDVQMVLPQILEIHLRLLRQAKSQN